MTATLETYCPYCDVEVLASVRRQTGTMRIRGEETAFDEELAICPTCGQAVGDSRVEDGNLDRAYAAYRGAHGIVSPEELRRLRNAYGLSTREFSRFLGFGEQTEHRYETGSIPERAHNAIILSAMTSDGAARLLSQNGGRITQRSAALVREYIATTGADEAPDGVFLPLYGPHDLSPCAANGFRAWDLARIRDLAILLAGGCRDLFVTKFQKAMFFADSLCYERVSRSLTGLTYAHGYYGPMINNRDALLYTLRQNGAVTIAPCGDGEVVRPASAAAGLFSPEEHEVIDEVVSFVNSFPTATALSEYSHGLTAWKDTENGEMIDYTENVGEVSRAIEARLGAIGSTR